MGKKKSKKEGETKNNDQQQNTTAKKEDGGKDTNSAVVLKIDLHCEGCASKVVKSIRSFEGVESVKRDDGDANKLKVTGNLDPVKLRAMVEEKTKKKVEILSPLPKKDKEDEKNQNGVGEGKKKKKNQTEDKQAKQPDEKKTKEPPVTTAVLKVYLHCEGCIQKIHKAVTKTKGFVDMSIDRQKDLLTVKGAMDMKLLAESLKEKLKKPVEIIPPKKEKEKSDGGEKEKGAGGGGGGGGDGGYRFEGNRMEYEQLLNPYPYVYGPGYMVANMHAPQIFSDENPNACVVM